MEAQSNCQTREKLIIAYSNMEKTFIIVGPHARRLSKWYGIPLRGEDIENGPYIIAVFYGKWVQEGMEVPARGRKIDDYFYDGTYLGPDREGVEPLWDRT
jgi:hypothetical protein